MIEGLAGTRSSSNSSLSREISVADLSQLRFGTYLVLIRLLLARLGYEFVGPLGRWHLKSYKPNGGADFVVSYNSIQGPVRVLVQVKQETRRLQRRYIDELRGKMLRANVSHGLVITLGKASRPARDAMVAFDGRPVRIVEGDELARLVIGTWNSVKVISIVSPASNSLANPCPIHEVIWSEESSSQLTQVSRRFTRNLEVKTTSTVLVLPWPS